MILAVQEPAHATMRREALVVETQSGPHRFDVEIAESEADKARGLMFRSSVPEGTGMLFPYREPQEITMWMRNTFVSLDMIFIRADGIVHRIETGTEPLSERVISSRGDVTAVLELAAGVSRRIGLRPGDRIRHRIFQQAP